MEPLLLQLPATYSTFQGEVGRSRRSKEEKTVERKEGSKRELFEGGGKDIGGLEKGEMKERKG